MFDPKLLRLGIIIVALVSGRPISAAIVGSWQFDEGSGTVINDLSGQGNIGTLINPQNGTWTDGKDGGGLYFDGTTGQRATWVNFGNNSSLQIANAISFSAWVKSSNPSRDAPILAKEGGGAMSYWFGVYHGKFGVLLDQDGVGSSPWAGYDRDNGAILANTWVHLASTWDGTTIRHYVNGKETNNASYSVPIYVSNAPLTLGVNSNYNSTAFQGVLDNVRLYNHALSAQEVQDSMQPDAAVPEPSSLVLFSGLGLMGLVGCWRRRKRTA